ncbi:hypothetical protein [Oceanobacillus halophilus]|uniref:Uncharacterized protein n=1 Tax=Oceanobacillus halophilus TaxID=930130 RepID=A0A494ZUG5_9BACI|nr:hypothetical protein [Oceanobacillus halophilus]RKQ29675.1 hypothetical protein D8M06_17245 [Oceanobacillus halophilus]
MSDKGKKEKKKYQVVNNLIDQHNVSIFQSQNSNGINQMVYENVTNSNNRAQITAFNYTPAPNTMILIIEAKNQPLIERVVPDNVVSGQSSYVIEVENLKHLSVRCQGNPSGNGTYQINIDTTFYMNNSDS